MRSMDSRRKLIEYFKKNLKKGYTEESLKWALVNQGYPRTSVENALKQAHKELAEKAPIIREKPIIRYEIIDERGNPIKVKKPFWRRFF